MTLLEQTKSLLQTRIEGGYKLGHIAELSGGKVEREWLYKFARDQISDPSVNRIQALHDHLYLLPEIGSA